MSAIGERALEHCRALLRIDTSNPGACEEPAAAYVVDTLAAAGIASEVVEPAPGRCSVVSRVPGSDPELPALLVHGHLDVVPAQDGWTHDPFGGVEADGFLWGRGAVDMKNAVAMMLAAQEALSPHAGAAPRRTLVFAYFADEEMGGGLGAGWIARNRPDLLAGVTEALGEVGGFAVALPDGRRLYPIQCGEKGMLWMRMVVRGDGGHAAYSTASNALVRAAHVVGEVARLELSETAPAAHDELVARLAEIFGSGDHDLSAAALDALGSFGAMARLGDRTRATPTVLTAGAKTNVIPDRAELLIDARVLPGAGEATIERLTSLLEPGDEHEVLIHTPGVMRAPGEPLYARCAAALREADPAAIVVPFVNSAGTDAQHLTPLGIAPYGFTPVVTVDGFDYLAQFHAVDERVPVEAVTRGAELLLDVIAGY